MKDDTQSVWAKQNGTMHIQKVDTYITVILSKLRRWAEKSILGLKNDENDMATHNERERNENTEYLVNDNTLHEIYSIGLRAWY